MLAVFEVADISQRKLARLTWAIKGIAWEDAIKALAGRDQPDLSGPVPMRDFGQFDRPVVTTAA